MVLIDLKFASAVIYFAVDFKYIRVLLNFCLSSTFLAFRSLTRGLRDFVPSTRLSFHGPARAPAWLVLRTARPTSAHMHTGVDRCPCFFRLLYLQLGHHIWRFSLHRKHFKITRQWNGSRSAKIFLHNVSQTDQAQLVMKQELWKSNLKQLKKTKSPSWTPQDLERALLALKTIRTKDPHGLLIELSRRIMPVKISKLVFSV